MTPTRVRTSRASRRGSLTWRSAPPRVGAVILMGLAGVSCAGAEGRPADEAAASDEVAMTEDERVMTADEGVLVELLAAGEAVFGIFSGDHTAEGGRAMAAHPETDFVFYSLESGPFDIPAMETYVAALDDASGEAGPPPIALRIPPVHADPAAARERVAEGLAAGVASIVFPHVVAREDAEVAVDAMGPELWPGNPDGSLVAMLIVEDREGIANVRDIVSTPGVSVVFAGPGDLRRAYEGVMEAVETAIQTVLAGCTQFDVPCGITAGVDDIAERLEQGFKVIIVTEPEALAVGLEAAGRME